LRSSSTWDIRRPPRGPRPAAIFLERIALANPARRHHLLSAGGDAVRGETIRTLARSWRRTARTSILAGLVAGSLSWVLPATWESSAVLLPPDRRSEGFQYSGGLADGLQRTLEAFRMQDRAHPSEIQRAVLRSEELARRLVRRFGLVERWKLRSEEEAAARISRAVETRLLPYGPIEIRVRLPERDLAADVANEAARILEERLEEIYREEIDWERTFLADALAAHAEEAERLGVDLADWRARRGLADRAEQSESAAAELRDVAARISEARLDAAEQARRHGAGSPAARDAARRAEELERVAIALPSALAQGASDRIREEELLRLEKTSRFLLALHRETLANEAGHPVAVSVLDRARPPESPDRRPLVAAVLLAMLAVPASIAARVHAPSLRTALAKAAPEISVLRGGARLIDAAIDPPFLPPRLREPALIAIAGLAGVTLVRLPWILAGLLGGLFVAFAAADRTKAWLLLLIALPWAWDHVDPKAGFGIQLPTEPGIILLVAAWACATALRGRLDAPPRVLAAPILATIAWVVISSTGTIDPKHSLFQIVATTGFLLGGALYPMCEIRRLETLERVLTIFLISGALLSIYGLGQMIGSPYGFDRAGTYMGEGLLYNHGPYSAFLGFALGPGLVYLLWGGRKRVSAPVAIATALMTLATIISLARAAWVAMIALLGVMALARWKRSVKALTPPVLGTGALLAILITASPATERAVSEYLERAVSPEYGSNVERLNRWLAGYRMLAANPVLGVGPSAYETAYPAYRDAAYVTGQSDERMGAHSDLVRTGAEQGVPGLIILTWMLWAFYRTGLRLMTSGSSPRIRRLAAAVTAGVFTYSVHGLFNEYWRLPKIALTLWAYVGVLGALERIDAAERTRLPSGGFTPETDL
jgi:hypothetical protein